MIVEIIKKQGLQIAKYDSQVNACCLHMRVAGHVDDEILARIFNAFDGKGVKEVVSGYHLELMMHVFWVKWLTKPSAAAMLDALEIILNHGLMIGAYQFFALEDDSLQCFDGPSSKEQQIGET